MNPKLRQYSPGMRSLFAALAIIAMAAVSSPGTASANTSAGAAILNVVTVDYQDLSGANTYHANASTTVTVNLVKAGLNPSSPRYDTGTSTIPGITCPTAPLEGYASGSTVSSLYALTATANGADTYNLGIGDNSPSTTLNASGISRAYSLLDYQGLTPTTPGTRTLGSAIPTRVVDAATLEFPGGALSDFAANDIVVVSYGADKKAYLVVSSTPGQIAIHNNAGAVAHNDVKGFSQPETKGTLVLAAYDDHTILLNGADVTFGGGNVAPDFINTPPTIGVPVGEMVLVKVDITATSNNAAGGDVGFDLTTTDSASLNPVKITCTIGKFKAPILTIQKRARNTTVPRVSAFAATASGNPGDILEYEVTVSNAGTQAGSVKVSDAIPSYTTLVTALAASGYGASDGTGAIANIFASITNNALAPNAQTIALTVDSADTEAQPGGTGAKVGYGSAGGTTATSALAFFMGDGSANNAGGKLPACSDTGYTAKAACETAGKAWITSYTILYKVKID